MEWGGGRARVTVFMCESGGTFLLCVTPHDNDGSLSAFSLPQNGEKQRRYLLYLSSLLFGRAAAGEDNKM
jgi:hypothetical protein